MYFICNYINVSVLCSAYVVSLNALHVHIILSVVICITV